jgi:hypothetical protein
MKFRATEHAMSYLRTKLHPLEKYWPWVKYGLLAACASMWVFALVDQLYSSAGVMKYLLMSMILFALALL